MNRFIGSIDWTIGFAGEDSTMVFGGEGPCSNTLLICRGRLSALALCGSDDLYWVSASVDLIVGML